MDIYRGDYFEQPVMLSKDTWLAGSTLMFGVKLSVDDDLTDASAVVKKTFTDDDITDTDDDYVYYLLQLSREETTVVPRQYIGEFQFVDPDGNPTTYDQFYVTIGGDINRRTE